MNNKIKANLLFSVKGGVQASMLSQGVINSVLASFLDKNTDSLLFGHSARRVVKMAQDLGLKGWKWHGGLDS